MQLVVLFPLSLLQLVLPFLSDMKKIIMSLLAAASLTVPALADDSKITKGYHTMDAMGCMLLRECTNGVNKVESIADLSLIHI